MAITMDTKTLEFVTYCICKLSQVLTFSSRYLVEDLIDYMREKGVLPQ